MPGWTGRSQPTVGSSFADIVARAKAGDDGAAGMLYNNHVAMVSGYLRARGAPNPEDLTSEVFVGMLRNIGRFEGDHADFRRWLMTITHRRLLDDRRRQKTGKVDFVDPAALDIPNETEVVELMAVVVNRDIIEAFTDLTEPQQEVLALRFIADISLEDVAAITGRPVGAVKSLQHRALLAIRQNLQSERAVDNGA